MVYSRIPCTPMPGYSLSKDQYLARLRKIEGADEVRQMVGFIYESFLASEHGPGRATKSS